MIRFRMRSLGLVLAACASLGAAPPALKQTIVTRALDSPVSMAVAPDGRVFICEQAGRVRVVRAGRLLHKSFYEVPTTAVQEEGLLAVAFDPDFAHTHWVYLLYTHIDSTRHERLIRVTASGDTAVAGRDTVLFDFDPHLDRTHVGGALHFGEDGMLYVGTGENGFGVLSQDLHSTHGKLLRLRRDGSIPEDNPWFTVTTERHRAIYARGLRNAFSMDIQRRTGRIFVNDVGADSTEEVNDMLAGGNYGWPIREGALPAEGLLPPVHQYSHQEGCAITGGLFYAPRRPRLPAKWVGSYLFADYCSGAIRSLDPAAPARSELVLRTVIPGPVDLRVAADGGLLYLARGSTDVTGGAHSSVGALVHVAGPRSSAKGR